MLTDLLLTHSNHLFQDPKQVQKMQPYPPLQTMLVAAVLRQAGLRVAICDTTFDDPRRAFLRAFEEHSPRQVVVCEDSFNFLTKMCLTRNRELACWMAQAARTRGTPVAVHGSDASDHPLEYRNAGFDSVLRGAAEGAWWGAVVGSGAGQGAWIGAAAAPRGASSQYSSAAARLYR